MRRLFLLTLTYIFLTMARVLSNTKILALSGISFYITVKDVKRLSMRPSADGNHICVTVPPFVAYSDVVKFISQNLNWARKALERTRDNAGNKYTVPDVEVMQHFIEDFKDRLFRIAREMGLHSRIEKVTFRYMKSRWGSCNYRTGHLSFNLFLVNFPAECLEYVIIHELSHLVHPNHSAEFWNHVEHYCPDWRSLRKVLR